jgi:hypothetical protein
VSWQHAAAGLIVAAAAAYLVWKLTRAARPPRTQRGPLVPAARLVRKPRRDAR